MLEELGSGIWTPVVWHLQDFFSFPLFSQHKLSHPLATKISFFNWFSLPSFSCSHIWPVSPLLSQHTFFLSSCLSSFLSSHVGSTSQTCSPWIAAVWLFPGYAVCCDNVSFFFPYFIAAWQIGEGCPVEQRHRRREKEREAWLRQSPGNSTWMASISQGLNFFLKRDLLSDWEEMITSEKVPDLKVSHSSKDSRPDYLFQCTASQFLRN